MGKRKRLFVAGAAACCIVIFLLVLAFFGAILIGAGQHHPPRKAEEVYMPTWQFFDEEGHGCRILPNDLEKGSWWTDGMYYFQVVQTGNIIRMEGMTLHEGGYDMELRNSNDTLRVVCDGDYVFFAPNGSCITHRELTSEDGEKVMEVLVALDEDGNPIAALERFDGDELKYETRAMSTILAGTYNQEHGKQQWEFLADGTVSIKEDLYEDSQATPLRYKFETNWHQPVNVIRLANQQPVSIFRDFSRLTVRKAFFDEEVELWEERDTIAELIRVEVSDDWCSRQLFCKAMIQVTTTESLMHSLQDYISDEWPIPCLNHYLMEHYIAQETEDTSNE